MKKNMQYYLKKSLWAVPVLLGVTIYSCTNDFDDLNKNPNASTPENVQPSFLIANTIAGSVLDPGMHERITQLTNDVFAQYYANEGFSTQFGVTNDEWLTAFYNDYHNRFVASLNDAIRLGRRSAKPLNETQIARIWRVWVFSRATDLWGDIPYFDAANGTGENAPYDKQELIYKDMLKELKEASDSLSASNPAQQVGQDYVYQDDIAKWKKFANSLRLRLALRISEVEPALSKSEAEAAVAAGVFTSEEENCLVPRSTGFGWGNEYQYTYYYGWGAETMSRSMENLLTGLGGQPFPAPPTGVTYTYDDAGITLNNSDENTLDPNANRFKMGVPSTVDPRGPIYFNVSNANAGTGTTANIITAPGETQTVNPRYRWHGVPAGLASAGAGRPQYSTFNNARLGAIFSRARERAYEVMTYHEVCFLLAEAASRGYNVGQTAKAWYETGIRESMKWHSDAVEAYLATIPQGSSDTPEGQQQKIYYELMQNTIIDDATIDAYIASQDENTYGTTVSFDFNSGETFQGLAVDDALSKIITQKYIAIFPDGGWEAWADHRRLHKPVFIPFAGGLDSRYTKDGGPDNFTKRVTYPSVEALNNKAFYDAAVQQLGGPDSEVTPVWWDND